MDEIEKKILERYEQLEQPSDEFFNWRKADASKLKPKAIETGTKPGMKNKIQDLRDHLFETIEKLKDGEIDLEKARAVADLAQVIVNSAKVEVDFLRAANVKSSYFFPVDEVKQLD